MKQDLLELIHLTELYIYENYTLAAAPKPKSLALASKKAAPPPPEPPKPVAKRPEKIETPKPDAKQPEKIEVPLPPPPKSAPPKADFNEWEKLFKEKLPHLKLTKDLPDDAMARQKELEWQNAQPIAYILVSFSSEKERSFLNDVASAITMRFGLTHVISGNAVPPEGIILTVPETARKLSLKEECVLVLEPTHRYLENYILKKALWKSIVERFS